MTEPLPVRNCGRCAHWCVSYYPVTENGYVEAMCVQPEDERDRKFKRASDTCGKWERKQS